MCVCVCEGSSVRLGEARAVPCCRERERVCVKGRRTDWAHRVVLLAVLEPGRQHAVELRREGDELNLRSGWAGPLAYSCIRDYPQGLQLIPPRVR